jgi:O-antigen ligase
MFTSDGKVFWLFPSGYTDYVLGPFVYRNQYAALIELLLPVALWRALREPARAFRFAGIAAVMGSSVVAAASRAGTVLVAAEVAAVLVLAAARGLAPRRAVGIVLAHFVLLALAAGAVVGWDVLERRFRDAGPYHVRHEMLLSCLDMVRERPWTGFGMGAWATAYPAYARFDDGLVANQAHNDWAQWAVEGGVPLAVMMLAFALLLAPASLRSLWGLGVAAVLLHSTVDYPLQQRPALGACFFAMAGALAAGASRRCAAANPGPRPPSTPSYVR